MGSSEPPASLAPYTDASLARLTLAHEASELADSARAFVPIHPSELRSTGGGGTGGSMVEDAARLRAQADQVLTLAVVYERLAGTSWEQIGVPGMTTNFWPFSWAAHRHPVVGA